MTRGVREGSGLATRWPWIGRVQVAIRRRIVPLGPVAESLPESGDFLEIGCGEGLVLQLLASPQRSLTGIDFDARKIKLARTRLQDVPNLELIQGEALAYLQDLPSDAFDAILIVDTLSSFDPADQEKVLAESRRLIRPNGCLVLKVIDGEAGWKTRLSRLLSGAVYRVFRLSASAGQRFTYLGEDALLQRLRAGGWAVQCRRLHRELHHPIPHLLFIARRPQEDPA